MMDLFTTRPMNMFNNIFNQKQTMLIDIVDNESNYLVYCDIPGRQKENINIEYKQDVLSIFATDEDPSQNELKYVRKERSQDFDMRSFLMPGIDFKSSKASYENGVLIITLPKVTKVDEKYLIDIE